MQTSPFVVFDKQGVIGALKATGSRDPDVLHAARGKLRAVAAIPQWVGLGFIVVGVLVAAGGQSAIAATVAVLIGGWFVFRGIRNLRMVEAGYQEYSARLQTSAPLPRSDAIWPAAHPSPPGGTPGGRSRRRRPND